MLAWLFMIVTIMVSLLIIFAGIPIANAVLNIIAPANSCTSGTGAAVNCFAGNPLVLTLAQGLFFMLAIAIIVAAYRRFDKDLSYEHG